LAALFPYKQISGEKAQPFPNFFPGVGTPFPTLQVSTAQVPTHADLGYAAGVAYRLPSDVQSPLSV